METAAEAVTLGVCTNVSSWITIVTVDFGGVESSRPGGLSACLGNNVDYANWYGETHRQRILGCIKLKVRWAPTSAWLQVLCDHLPETSVPMSSPAWWNCDLTVEARITSSFLKCFCHSNRKGTRIEWYQKKRKQAKTGVGITLRHPPLVIYFQEPGLIS